MRCGGRTIPEALQLVERFQAMMRGGEEFPREQRALNAMKGVAQFPVRIKCANLAWHALKYALESPEPQANGSAFVSNENTD